MIIDPAPAPNEWADQIFKVDLLCPNESEAAAFVGTPAENVHQAESAARAIHEKGATHVAITLATMILCYLMATKLTY